jgi:uncharacterized membrane protein
MYKLFFLSLLFYAACTLPERKRENQLAKKPDTIVIQTDNDYAAALDTPGTIRLPKVKKIQPPAGIYRTVIAQAKMQQIIAFNSDFSYRLEEKYFADKKDSLVITDGTWSPSDGFIWLYKDQIVRGRYKWKADTLQYYSPLMKRSFSMQHLQEALQNTAWDNKGKQGIIVSGVGNEPFWNVELDKKDSISFTLAEWNHPLRLKIDSSFNNKDGVAYMAHHDSVQVVVTIFPQFCSDGMSDFIYRNKVKVQYNQQVYTGCGVVYKQ